MSCAITDVVILLRSGCRSARTVVGDATNMVSLPTFPLRKLTIGDCDRFDARDLVHPMSEASLFEIRASDLPSGIAISAFSSTHDVQRTPCAELR